MFLQVALDGPPAFGQRRGVTAAAEDAAREDPGLVAAARRGDRAAFEILYRRYAGMVHGILLASLPRLEVEDLVQDVFLRAYRRLVTLRDDGAFGGWIAAIARNRARDFHRRAAPTQELPRDLPAPDSGEREAAAVLDLVRTLPDAYRETLVLRLVEGLTGPEIARRCGLTPGSVRVNLHRGMAMLRAKMRGQEP